MGDPKKVDPSQPTPDDGIAGPEDVNPTNIDQNFRDPGPETPVDAPHGKPGDRRPQPK